MNIKLLVVGKTDSSELQSLIDRYTNRLKHYVNFTVDVLPDIKNVKNLSEAQQKDKEAEALLKKTNSYPFCLLV